MKIKEPSCIVLFILAMIAITDKVNAQNALINILSQKTGVVKQGERIFVEVTINNTDPNEIIGVYKLKVQLNVPDLVHISDTGHIVPDGWQINKRDDRTIILTNGKDIIASNDARSLLISMQADKIGGPSTVAGSVSFSNGKVPGTEPGTMRGDVVADNSSTTSIKVIK